MAKYFDEINNKIIHIENIIDENRDEIGRKNISVLRYIMLGAAVVFAAVFILTFINPQMSQVGYSQLRIAYICIFCYTLADFFIVKKIPPKYSNICVYVTYAGVLAYCIFISVSFMPTSTCVTILVLLLHIPVLYVDKSWKINLYVLLCATIYLAATFNYCSVSTFTEAIVNVLSFSIFGMVIGTFSRGYIIENISIKNELRHMVYFDALTGIYNRRKFFEDLQQIEKNDTNISGMAMIDVDNFKKFNDTYGHQSGDECLKKISDCFAKFQNDCNVDIYRYGGEEFTVIFFSLSKDKMLGIAENIRAEIQKLNIPHEKSEKGIVTISTGVADFNENDRGNFEKLISKADTALYAAKNAGRNIVAPYSSELEAE